MAHQDRSRQQDMRYRHWCLARRSLLQLLQLAPALLVPQMLVPARRLLLPASYVQNATPQDGLGSGWPQLGSKVDHPVEKVMRTVVGTQQLYPSHSTPASLPCTTCLMWHDPLAGLIRVHKNVVCLQRLLATVAFANTSAVAAAAASTKNACLAGDTRCNALQPARHWCRN